MLAAVFVKRIPVKSQNLLTTHHQLRERAKKKKKCRYSFQECNYNAVAVKRIKTWNYFVFVQRLNVFISLLSCWKLQKSKDDREQQEKKEKKTSQNT